MARNKQMNEQMREARIEEILKNSLRFFSMRGLSATKISDIAESNRHVSGTYLSLL